MYAIALIVMAVVAAVITKYIIPLLQSKTSVAEQEKAMLWVSIVVAAAEQLFPGTGRGAEKKAYALSRLLNVGLSADSEEVNAMVEAEVYKLDSNTSCIEK